MESKVKLDTDELMSTFGLNRNLGCLLLAQLLENPIATDDVVLQKLEAHRQTLSIEGDFWNEEELKMQFLAFLFFYLQMNEPQKIKVFYERSLLGIVEGKKISVKCDCLMAKPIGINKPSHPYFFLQEYAPFRPPTGGLGGTDDAEGQMLGAMLLAQQINGNEKPVYGAFLQGKNWVFTTLHHKNYCISKQYDATEVEDLRLIVTILKNLKHVILTKLSQN
jgi:hypothetical protein